MWDFFTLVSQQFQVTLIFLNSHVIRITLNHDTNHFFLTRFKNQSNVHDSNQTTLDRNQNTLVIQINCGHDLNHVSRTKFHIFKFSHDSNQDLSWLNRFPETNFKKMKNFIIQIKYLHGLNHNEIQNIY